MPVRPARKAQVSSSRTAANQANYLHAIVLTVVKALASPVFKVRVTGPVASAQEMFRARPAVIPTKEAGPLVKLTALATAQAAAATRANENCILKVAKVLELSIEFGGERLF